MAISLVNNLSMNRSDTAVADQVWTATSATLSDFQAAAGGAWNKLQKVTISDDALIEFDTTYITSAYSVYKFIISDLVPATDDKELYCQFKHGGSYQTSANGWVVMQFNTNSATVNATGDSNSTQIRLTNDNLGNTGGENSYWELTLDNPLGTANVKKMGGVGYIYDADQKYRCDNFLGGSSYLGGVVTAIDALKFYMESGNLTSGTITLYGITT
jgi:hypothetical protein